MEEIKQFKSNIVSEKISWDNYSFSTYIGRTKFTGQLFTCNACKDDVTEERIFKEHMEDFENIICYCFFRKLPFIEHLLLVDFIVMTDRHNGYTSLIEMHCTYSNGAIKEAGSNTTEHKEFISDVKELINTYVENYWGECGYFNMVNGCSNDKDLTIDISKDKCARCDDFDRGTICASLK